MFRLLYNALLLVFVALVFPKVLYERLCRGKYKHCKNKLGFELPNPSLQEDDFVVWIHAVSMGETKAAAALFRLIKNHMPYAKVFVSSTTQTGHDEAKKSMASADGFFFLPLDFSWTAGKWMARLKPDIVVFVESDFWYNYLTEAKKAGALVFLVNGKISERSFERFRTLPFFAKKIFSLFDHLFVQSETYAERFLSLGVSSQKISVTGNMKLDIPVSSLSPEQKQEERLHLGLTKDDFVITIGSTHAPEEIQLMQALKPVWEKFAQVKILLVPRHPERFSEVNQEILSMQIPMICYSKIQEKTGKERVILIDAMGFLMRCYQISDLSIVAGSFTDRVGGHNIFEPILANIPVLFGPHMHTQTELVKWVLDAQAGVQVELSHLPSAVMNFIQSPSFLEEYKDKGKKLLSQEQGAVNRTWQHIHSMILQK